MSEFSRETLLNIIETDHVQCGEASALARMALAAMDSEPHTDDELSNLLWYSQEATCHSDPNYYCEFQRLATPGLIAGIIRELQERRKAAMDSEPVIIVGDDGGDALSYRRLIQSFEPGTKLYRHAQPVTVVSADLLYTAASAIEDLLTTKDRTGACVWFDLPFRLRSAANAQPAPVVPEEKPIPNTLSMYAVDAVAAIAEVKGWNACRAAMLAAAPQSPGSEPATVPGKWIPVSERMPENDGAYLCWDNRYVTTYAFMFGAWQANQFVAKNITHWMPLPAAPQEVKSE